jgi:uncharacterized RmlC-like cupin family protein
MGEPAKWNSLYFREWVAREGLDLIGGYKVDDIYTVPLKPWARNGGNAVWIELDGTGDMDAALVCEIPPGKELAPQRHLYEALVYVLSGRGITSVWYPGRRKNSFEWKAGSLFALPLNAWYQHFNGSGTEPARFVAVCTAPIALNLYRDERFIFDTDVVFPSRYDSEEDYFSGKVEYDTYTGWGWPSSVAFGNFFPDIADVEYRASTRGVNARAMVFEVGNGVLAAHKSYYPGGTFTKIHRHGPGAHVLWLKGEGYTLMWPDVGEKVQAHWKPGTIVVPPSWWWHQHCVVSEEAGQYLALRFSANRNQVTKLTEDVMKSARDGGQQVDFEDFPPELMDEVRRIFAAECAKRGTAVKM